MLTGTFSLFECCLNVAAVGVVIVIFEVAFVAGAVVVFVVVFVVPIVFSRSSFTELFVPVEEFLIFDSFVLPA